jgi:hypothetical protein
MQEKRQKPLLGAAQSRVLAARILYSLFLYESLQKHQGEILFFPSQFKAAELSDASSECLECHESIAPGMVAGWKNSRHARVSPLEGLKKPELERRVSAKWVPSDLASVTP